MIEHATQMEYPTYVLWGCCLVCDQCFKFAFEVCMTSAIIFQIVVSYFYINWTCAFYVCPVFYATAVWLRDLLIIKFKPGGIVLNSICFSYRSFDTFMDDVWSMFTVSFRSFLTRELVFTYVQGLLPPPFGSGVWWSWTSKQWESL